MNFSITMHGHKSKHLKQKSYKFVVIQWSEVSTTSIATFGKSRNRNE